MFPCPRSRLRIWSRETGSAVLSRVGLLISILPRLNLVFTYKIPPELRIEERLNEGPQLQSKRENIKTKTKKNKSTNGSLSTYSRSHAFRSNGSN